MKKFATIAALMATALGVSAQGLVNFANTSTTLVNWGQGGAGAQGTAVDAAAGVKVGLYYNGALVSTQFPILGTTSTGTANPAFNGRFNGGQITVPGLAAGANGTSFEVKAWSGNFTSYEAATTGGATYRGASGVFTNPTGGAVDPVTGIPSPAAALSGFTGMTVSGIPEPSTYALAGLGLGALLLIRRRK